MDELAPPLQYSLEMELAAGNEVVEVAIDPGWPPECEVFVGLKRKFSKPHKLSFETTLNNLDDYHYWFADYSYNGSQQILVCRFDPPISKFELILTKVGRIFSW